MTCPYHGYHQAFSIVLDDDCLPKLTWEPWPKELIFRSVAGKNRNLDNQIPGSGRPWDALE